MILLHDPHAEIGSPNCPSSERVLAAARAILELMYKLCATTYDLLYLDHASTFFWFLAGVVLIQFLKAKKDAGLEDEVAAVNQELGIVR